MYLSLSILLNLSLTFFVFVPFFFSISCLQSDAIAFLVAGIVHVFVFSFEFVFNFLYLRPFLFLHFFSL